jgi:NitT/TauT family transport system substrate-binding protein
VLLARAQGIKLKQIYAPHGFPSCLMAHSDSGIKSFADLKGSTVAVAPGAAWWPVVKAKYGLESVKTVNYAGTVAPFLADKRLVQQCYVTNEPFQARDKGAGVTVLPIADSGFNPYADTLVTTDQELEQQPDVVRKLVAAVAAGWKAYDADPAAVFAKLSSLGDASTPSQRKDAWTALKPINNASGSAVDAVVKETADLLVQTQALPAAVGGDYKAAYDNGFLPAR